KGCSNSKNCVCLSIGMVFGLCVAGIFFYSSLPNEECRSNSKNLMKIMGIEGLKNKTENNSSKYFNLEPITEQSTFPSTTVSLENTDEEILADNDVSDEVI
ncbi:hypothetical protein KR038_009441, partial [Drosophila bunnanda]